MPKSERELQQISVRQANGSDDDTDRDRDSDAVESDRESRGRDESDVSSQQGAPGLAINYDNQVHYTGPVKQWAFAVNNPSSAYGMTCSAHCTVVIIWVVLVAALGATFFPFSADVPLYLRDNKYKERDDAFQAAKLAAPLTPAVAKTQLERSETYAEIDLIYVADTGNMLEETLLNNVRNFEREFEARPDYSKWCTLDWSSQPQCIAAQEKCEGGSDADCQTVVNCNNNLKANLSCLKFPNIFAKNSAAGETDSVAPTTAPPTILNSNGKLVDTNWDFKKRVTAYANSNAFTNPGANVFLRIVDAKFGNGREVSAAIHHVYGFGYPLQGFSNTADRTDDQHEKIEDYTFDTYVEWLLEQSVDGMTMLFDGSDPEGKSYFQLNYTQVLLATDGSLAILSFVFVWFYMTGMLGSWFLSTMGMGQILMSFCPAYMLYFLFGQRFFGTFNVLSIFIILGIGADDIFVFMDTWRQSKGIDPRVSASQLDRMSYTWKRAGRAMLVTSVTTIASFLSNSISSFPAISTFGIFTAMMVLVNYCSVISFFPTVVLKYEESFADKSFCCGLYEKLKSINFTNNDSELERRKTSLAIEVAKLEKELGLETHEHEESLGAAEKWFKHTFSPFVIKFRFAVILVFVCVLVTCIVFVSQLRPDESVPNAYPDGHNFKEYRPTLARHFARGPSTFAIKVNIGIGINPDNPIDRAGTQPTNGTDYGEVQWCNRLGGCDNSLGLWMPGASRCLLQMCDNAMVQDDKLKLGGGGWYAPTCFMHDFRTHVLNTQGQAVWNAALNNDTQWFQLVNSWASQPATQTQWSKYLLAEGIGGTNPNDAKIRFLWFQVGLTADVDINFNDGQALSEEWEKAYSQWIQQGECATLVTEANRAVTQTKFAGFIDGRTQGNLSPGFQWTPTWHLFFLQQKLAQEAFSGIAISLAIAFGVLTMASMNVAMAFTATMTIVGIVVSVMGISVMMGWKLGVVEAICYVMVPGMSVDFVAHLAEAYIDAPSPNRHDRVTTMLTHVGISVISGAVSTLGAAFFLFFATISFFVKFGIFIFFTIFMSLCFALLFFSAVLAAVGPQGDTGNLVVMYKKIVGKND
eukprot:GFYU01006182.1.p1 GENE.GFYU01006182.1~~GFYU01006182.1.p1  ORF type:complete len:1128 (-),score=371.69 GFYU01006182.1:28-3294(-)